MMFLLSLLPAIKAVLFNRVTLYIAVGLAIFMAGFMYRGSCQAQKQVKEIVRYIRTVDQVRDKYDKIPLDTKEELEAVLSCKPLIQ